MDFYGINDPQNMRPSNSSLKTDLIAELSKIGKCKYPQCHLKPFEAFSYCGIHGKFVYYNSMEKGKNITPGSMIYYNSNAFLAGCYDDDKMFIHTFNTISFMSPVWQYSAKVLVSECYLIDQVCRYKD